MKLKIVLTLALTSTILTNAGCYSAESIDNRTRSSSSGTPQQTSASASPTPSSTTEMKNETNKESKQTGFSANIPSGFSIPSDDVGKRLVREYGSMFVARGVTPPVKVVFRDESEVSAWQSGVQSSTESIGGFSVELQTAAMNALKEAIADAKAKNLKITPRNADAAKRTYSQTVDNWKSRVDPGLQHWVSKGKIDAGEAKRIAALSPTDQVPEILKLEGQGLYFAKDFEKTILYSVAAPGASQHISMLALDVAEFDNAAVRRVLADHGWFQTIPSDLPHFTYLGAKESELEGLGLKRTTASGRDFWVPNI